MNVIFVGDVVGPQATEYLVGRLPGLREMHDVDIVIVNAENCAVTGTHFRNGFGMDAQSVDMLVESGVDVITGGNHSWDGPEADAILEHRRVLRPHNVPADRAGKGVLTCEIGGETVSIVNLASTDAIPEADPLYESWLSVEAPGTIIVDLHAMSTPEKQTFAFAIDGGAAAVMGTHSHEPTLPLHLLPRGTALVTDVGMTGPRGGVCGIEPEQFVAELKGNGARAPAPFGLPAGEIMLGAILMRLEGSRTTAIERLG